MEEKTFRSSTGREYRFVFGDYNNPNRVDIFVDSGVGAKEYSIVNRQVIFEWNYIDKIYMEDESIDYLEKLVKMRVLL